ncbi:hypothetical protein [Flavobacterium sp.]|uniref:hypothetical protein n=1 Tax=Flavobacterium sp. TaxID=239 RepID=UPI0038FC686E
MKNKLNLATLIAIGLVVVSCSTDSVDNDTSAQKQNYELNTKNTDSIPIVKTIFAGDDGVINPTKPK